MPYGGPNKSAAFRAKVNGTTDGYDLVQIDGTTAAAVFADNSCLFQLTVEHDIQFQEDGTVKMALNQDKDDSEYMTFLDKVAVPYNAGVKISERVYEDGSKKYGDQAYDESNLVVMLVPGALNDAGTERKLVAAIGYVSPTSGSYKQNATSTSNPSYQFIGIIAKYALDVKAIVDTALFTAPTAFIIPADKGFKRAYQAVA